MDVFCAICGQKWDMRDLVNVRRIWGEDHYECTDEGLCFERKAMNALAEEMTRERPA